MVEPNGKDDLLVIDRVLNTVRVQCKRLYVFFINVWGGNVSGWLGGCKSKAQC